jgi:hypothetical protein
MGFGPISSCMALPIFTRSEYDEKWFRDAEIVLLSYRNSSVGKHIQQRLSSLQRPMVKFPFYQICNVRNIPKPCRIQSRDKSKATFSISFISRQQNQPVLNKTGTFCESCFSSVLVKNQCIPTSPVSDSGSRKDYSATIIGNSCNRG